MLENFVSNENNSEKINSENLRKNVEEIFQIMGENQTDSKIAADALILADLRGVESHGMICSASEIGFDKLEQSEKVMVFLICSEYIYKDIGMKK